MSSHFTVIDLTHPIEPDMPVFPGTPLPTLAASATLAVEGYAERRLTICSHTGTHVDAAAHVFTNGGTLDSLGAEHFLGRGLRLDMRGQQAITPASLRPHEALLAQCDFLLLCTGWDTWWGGPNYFQNYPTLTPEATQWLLPFKLKGLGMDTISVDAPGDTTLPVHRALLGNGWLLIENLKNLQQLPETGFTFSCLPLPISGGDGSPVRAIAMLDV